MTETNEFKEEDLVEIIHDDRLRSIIEYKRGTESISLEANVWIFNYSKEGLYGGARITSYIEQLETGKKSRRKKAQTKIIKEKEWGLEVGTNREFPALLLDQSEPVNLNNEKENYKIRLMNQSLDYYRTETKDYNTSSFYEPFMLTKKAFEILFSDIDKELVRIYQSIKEHP